MFSILIDCYDYSQGSSGSLKSDALKNAAGDCILPIFQQPWSKKERAVNLITDLNLKGSA